MRHHHRNYRLTDFQKRHGKISGALFATFILFYLVSHALSGERGLYVLMKEQRHLELLRAELDDVTAQRKALEHRAALLGGNGNAIDSDLLDEQARRYLGAAAKDEMVITLPSPQKETK